MKLIFEKRSDRVGELVINRPHRKNAIDFDVIHAFQHYLQKVKEDENLIALIIRGNGDTFCSGGDLNDFHQLLTKEEALTMLKPMSQVLKDIVSLPIITISYLNGTAVGGGAELACATDFRIAQGRGQIGFIQGNLHITTGWGGGSLLKKRIGLTNSLTLLSTGQRITMEEALQIGFVQQIVNDINDLKYFTNQFFSRQVIQNYKETLLPKNEVDELFLAMDKEVEACASLWELEEHHEAVQSFFNKRK